MWQHCDLDLFINIKEALMSDWNSNLMPFWQLTSEQDWELCEYAQPGINSSFYRPGPYSTHKEYNVDAFVRWYLEALAQ